MTDWRDSLNALRDTLPPGATDPGPADDAPAAPSAPVTLTVSRSTKGRAGKVATLIEGFPGVTDQDLALVKETASTLRRQLGTGGSHRDCEILIQGDCRRQVIPLLRSLGFTVKG